MTIRKPKEIIDGDALLARIRDLAAQTPDPALLRPQVTPWLQDALASGRAEIRQRFEAGNKPTPCLKEMTYLIDSLLEASICAAGCENGGDLHMSLSVIAVGGYGRRELFPYSDIDLLFLHADKHTGSFKKPVQSVLYYLWDLGLQVGHATRSMSDAVRLAQDDHTVAANLLDMRLVCGHEALFNKLAAQYEKQVRGHDPMRFVEDKLQERAARHLKHGNSRFLLEPNIKENKGGLRDLHTLYWLAKYVYGARSFAELIDLGMLSKEEARAFAQAEQFLWTVRAHLHWLAGRAEERLTFDVQKRIGEKLGYRTTHQHRPVERFMKRYFQVAKTIGDLTRLFCAILEEEHKRRPRIGLMRLLERSRTIDDFVIDGQRLNFHPDTDLSTKPIMMLKLFHTAQAHDLDIHPRAWQEVTRHLRAIDENLRQDAQANHLFMGMLLSPKGPEITLRRLNEAGVLGRFIPDFARVVGQMQYDMYHVFTVDEHTIRALGILHNIEIGKYQAELPLATRVIQHIESRHVLYLSLLCHDIGKGRGGNHQLHGEKIVRKLARRFGFDALETDTAAWLVREHILCTDIAFKRDLSDPKTISDFIEKVQSPERLRLLLVLSVADIRAVGPHIWNGWKGSLLRELYYRSEEQLGTSPLGKRVAEIEQFKSEMHGQLAHWSDEDRTRYFDNGFPAFWLSRNIAQHAEVADMLREQWQGNAEMGFHTHIDPFHAITHVIVCLPGYHALIRDIAGTIALIGASIAGAKIFTLRDGMAVAMFDIQNKQAEAFDDESRLQRLREHILSMLHGNVNLALEVLKQQPAHYGSSLQALDVPNSIFIDNKISDKYTVIEVNGLDRIGFLYDVTSALIDMRLTIATAHITTYGEKAVDVFYVKDNFGLKIEHPAKLEQIRQHVLQALAAYQPVQAAM